MANIIPFKVGSNEVLPTANATHYSDLMSADYVTGHVYAEFFSDAAGTIRATPTAGTVTVKGTPTARGSYMAAGNVSHINASQAGVSPTYEPPVFSGCMVKSSVTFDGITGADYARITIWRA